VLKILQVSTTSYLTIISDHTIKLKTFISFVYMASNLRHCLKLHIFARRQKISNTGT